MMAMSDVDTRFIFERDGKFGFLDETGDEYYPYNTSDEARDNLIAYCQQLNSKEDIVTMSELYLRIMGGTKEEEAIALQIVKEALILQNYQITDEVSSIRRILFKKIDTVTIPAKD